MMLTAVAVLAESKQQQRCVALFIPIFFWKTYGFFSLL